MGLTRPLPGEYAEGYAPYLAKAPEGDALALLEAQLGEVTALYAGFSEAQGATVMPRENGASRICSSTSATPSASSPTAACASVGAMPRRCRASTKTPLPLQPRRTDVPWWTSSRISARRARRASSCSAVCRMRPGRSKAPPMGASSPPAAFPTSISDMWLTTSP